MEREILYHSICGYSTIDYFRSFAGQLKPFQYQGKLRLTTKALTLEGKKLSLHIPVASLVSVNLETLPRWSQPLGLDYISLKYLAGKNEKTIILIPKGWFEGNGSTREWYKKLQEIISKNEGFILMTSILFLSADPTNASRLRVERVMHLMNFTNEGLHEKDNRHNAWLMYQEPI